MLEIAALAAQCAPEVHPTTLMAVVMHESKANPFAIGINGDVRLPRQPETKAEAIETATWLKEQGYNFDAGLGQINIKNFEWLGLSIAEAFEPCSNLRGAATVLTNCYGRAVPRFKEGQQALRAALSCYNTGNFSAGFRNGYVVKVAGQLTQLIPALEHLDSVASAPVRLQPLGQGETTLEVAPEDTAPAERRSGIPDAFGLSKRDAFGRSDHLFEREAAGKSADIKG